MGDKEDELEKKRELMKQEGPGESRRRKPKANKSADNISYGVGAVFAVIALVLLGLCVPHDSGASALGANSTNASSASGTKMRVSATFPLLFESRHQARSLVTDL